MIMVIVHDQRSSSSRSVYSGSIHHTMCIANGIVPSEWSPIGIVIMIDYGSPRSIPVRPVIPVPRRNPHLIVWTVNMTNHGP